MKSEIVTYAIGKLTAEGVLVYDDKVRRKRPAVLMAPNWLGLTDHGDRTREAGGRRSLRGVCCRHVWAGHSPGRF